jgi:5,10-methylenetetrahydromethanopterin reductase
MQLWTYRHAAPGRFERQAQRAESEGWDGIALGESQNLTADPFVELGIAARFTSRILLGTSVAITATRHPATTATAIATVQEESAGRAVLAIGTGASAVAHLGMRPMPVRQFERYLRRLAGYLAGAEVPFAPELDGSPGSSSAAMGLAAGPTASRLRWLNPAMPKVVLDVAATGPRTIAAGACIGDRVLFATGASTERLAWAIETAAAARDAAGLPGDGLPFGASFPLFVHPDRARARDLISGTVASFAHLATVLGPVVGPATGEQRTVLTALRDAYDMDRHLSHGSPQSALLSDEVLDAFAVAGPVSYCVERILALRELGISKFVFFSEGADIDPKEIHACRARIAEELLPALRAGG